ncbi:hypothetical protein D9757_013768 [Collybiopsis confluens]|uniref:Uncharacterized protein n=1 Tax=Collybiopsis confluens TaxID=2823264 RepID=A0A8H5FV52_9AGAR|nr:hypothetical protein D9757_013768 [Collybiopsis confluens]
MLHQKAFVTYHDRAPAAVPLNEHEMAETRALFKSRNLVPHQYDLKHHFLRLRLHGKGTTTLPTTITKFTSSANPRILMLRLHCRIKDFRLRRRGDITPRANLISLETSANLHDSLPHSHLSQSKVNHYHQGSVTSEHRHPTELDDSSEVDSRSQLSRYSLPSYDPGYDAASSRRDSRRSWGSFPSDTAEKISISSTQHSGSSRDRLSFYGGGEPSSADLISISSSRRSSISGSQSVRYDGQSVDSSQQEAQSTPALRVQNQWSTQLCITLPELCPWIANAVSDPSAVVEYNMSCIKSGLRLDENAYVEDESALDFIRSLAGEITTDGPSNAKSSHRDPAMEIELYERTWEQNEELGLNDIKVEGYESDKEEEEADAKAKDGEAEEKKVE